MNSPDRISKYAVDFSRSCHVQLRPVPVGAVTLGGDFWQPRMARNVAVTLPSQYALLESTGRLNNFRRLTGECTDPYAGIFFNDSDVYKWLEAAAWAQVHGPVPELEKHVDEAITLIENAQEADGYINTYFSLERKHLRWTDLRDLHEMYCGGHLIQAAVAHHRVTGSDRLLNVATRFADLLCELFGPVEQGKRVAVDGHEEIEMALIELARETGNSRYLQQARFFIEARGQRTLTGGRWGVDYFQDHVPIREMTTLCGHAVRALYMACGVTDLALETGDTSLLDVLEKQWTNLVTRRMYISGGLGSRHDGEALGKDFELPNERAYTETCAAIGSMMWNHRLLAATGHARYADLIEWTLYNGMLPGWGLDGKHYFYVNPLADDGEHHRQPWYDVACCPPNVARTLAELPGYVYSTSEDEIWVNLYMHSEAQIPLGDRVVALSLRCNYPWDGHIDLTVGTAGSFAINVRIPGWCQQGATVRVNGDAVAGRVVPGEYLTIERLWKPGDVIALDFPMTIQIWQSHPHLHDNAGRVALSRGPVLYCLEGVDHPGGDLQDLVLKGDVPLEAVFEPGLLGGVMVLNGAAHRQTPDDAWRNALYRPVTTASQSAGPSQPLRAIPYFVWQNRGASRMAVWLAHDGQCGCGA
ncbi:glycoside hydrolase family 127 protein [Silvimonas iriomotensis]|uniref:Glycoside hydrolase family 127 protein n=1 Tax=Silvimonas iriomotensis TaxID=449662 RepID=A0ABQ2P9Q3_9NEIS|nr:beta-L-arabinofuranosidase domain-containing protein [Silvimonas iriomotensis]GGP21089.1 hypothetical protein GCM10010970_18700 [Silvimonas iriomotensis]